MTDLRDEYRRQYRWRDWASAYAALPDLRDRLVLDLGCAVGDQARALAARGARVVGIDGDPALLDEARRSGDGVTYRHADLRDLTVLSLPPADGLWLSFTAAYFPDLATQLPRWCRLLKPGGWVALVEVDGLLGHAPLDEPSRDVVRRYYARALARGAYDFRMGGKLAEHAADAGLVVASAQVLSDEELSFQGPARPEVLTAWRQRLDRLGALRDLCGADDDDFCRRFVECLASPEHRSHATVHFVLASTAAAST